MEGKTVILSVLIMSLVMAQNQIEAKSCCPTTTSRNIYNTCRLTGASRETCAKLAGCTLVPDGKPCPSGYPNENSGDAFNEYCKLGCASSVCDALTTLQNSDASETVNGAIAQCTNACTSFCAKGSANAVEAA